MLEKILLFGVGYVLGAKAGKGRYEELVGTVKELAERDEVKMALGIARGLVADRIGSATKLAA